MFRVAVFFVLALTALRAHAQDDVRLVEGPSSNEGRVEVNVGGAWGTVCDDRFTTRDAQVFCRQLGFEGVAETKPRAYYGQGSGEILLDNLDCSGLEASISACRGDRGVGNHDCEHDEDVGVVCHEPVEVRLVGGSTDSEGRVEVSVNGQWGTVCDDDFDINDANVVCRQMGYTAALSVPEEDRAHFGQGAGPIHFDNLRCRGTESSIALCPRYGFSFLGDDNDYSSDSDIGHHDCGHDEDAGVVCNGIRSSPSSAAKRSTVTHYFFNVCFLATIFLLSGTTFY